MDGSFRGATVSADEVTAVCTLVIFCNVKNSKDVLFLALAASIF